MKTTYQQALEADARQRKTNDKNMIIGILVGCAVLVALIATVFN